VAERAAQAARMIAMPTARADALIAVAIAAIGVDKAYSLRLAEEAARLADAITGNWRRTEAITAIVTVVTGVGPGRARGIATSMLDFSGASIADVQTFARAALAVGASLPTALETAREIGNLSLREHAATIIALALARADADGALAIVNRTRTTEGAKARQEVALSIAAGDPDKALQCAAEKGSPEYLALMQAVGPALAATDPARVGQLPEVEPPTAQAVLLARMAQAAVADHPAEAAQFSVRAAQLARGLENKTCYEEVSAILLGVIAYRDPDRAERMAAQLGTPGRQTRPQLEIARMVATTDPSRALRIATGIEHPQSQAEALVEVARQVSRPQQASREAGLRALALLLSGDHWTAAFGVLATADLAAARAGCEALIAEPAFSMPGDSTAVDNWRMD
jgi:hypothetical protein